MGEQRSQETPGSAGGGNSEVKLITPCNLFLVNWTRLLSAFSFRSSSRSCLILALHAHSLSAFLFVFKDLIKCSFLLFSLTDRHTLWRCLQSSVTPVLASMLEVMDRFANLDLLSDDRLSEGLIKLWLDILEDSQILDLAPLQSPRYR